MTCVACRQGFTWECQYHGTCGSNSNRDSNNRDSTSSEGDSSIESGEPEFEDGESGIEIRTQDDSKLKDQQSTGRKRAAKMYPLADGAPCEWRNKKDCGGGNKPIVGCSNGTQQARHHGPDKNTLNNEKGNVHRICHTCHNRWHTENDEGYVWGSNYNPHAPVAATNADLVENELSWLTRDIKDVKD